MLNFIKILFGFFKSDTHCTVEGTKNDLLITFIPSGKQYRGSCTVWHTYPDGNLVTSYGLQVSLHKYWMKWKRENENE